MPSQKHSNGGELNSGVPHVSPRDVRVAALAAATKGRAFGWRRKVATVGAAALAAGLAYGVVFGHNGLTAFAHKRQEARDLQRQTQELQMENDRLRERVDHLETDPGSIEHEAREDLHYTRAGEVIVTMPAKPASTQPLPPE